MIDEIMHFTFAVLFVSFWLYVACRAYRAKENAIEKSQYQSRIKRIRNFKTGKKNE